MSNPSGLTIRPLRETELADASGLCMRSKAYWGYDEAFMAACRKELTLVADDLRSSDIAVAVSSDKIVGVAQLRVENGEAELEKLFVDPVAMGQGVGRVLLEWSKETAKGHGATALTLAADPFAVPFYEKVGFERIGEEQSVSIPGRALPVYALPI